MTITPEQLVAITAKLSVSLSTLTDDKLIELCLLYRSAPEALPTFPDLLRAEITRRFTAAEIAANDVMFSVINNFSNNFDPLIGYQDKFYRLAVTDIGQRDNWFRDNATFFYRVLHSTTPLSWLVGNVEIMGYVAASSVAMAEIAVSSVAMGYVAASSVAMTAVIASSTAMTAVAESSVALSKIVVSTTARNILMNNNSVFQSVRQQFYDTVKTTWVKKAGVAQGVNPSLPLTNINSAVAAPQGFVFASLGWSTSFTAGTVEAKHPNGVIANTAGTSSSPTTLAKLDAISFDGATFKGGVGNYPAGYAELWSPT